jgi:hypothetical protein
MVRFLMGVGLVVCAAGTAAAYQPDSGRPFRPAGTGYVYVENNWPATVRVVWSSATRDTYDFRLGPGGIARIPVRLNGRPRVLTAYEVRSGAVVTTRELELHDEHVYEVDRPIPVPVKVTREVEVTRDGRKERVRRTMQVTPPDKGKRPRERPRDYKSIGREKE